MDDLRLSDTGKARLFRGAYSREQAGLLPICDVQNDWRNTPALQGAALRAFWEQAWDRPSNTLATSHDSRLLAAWRLTRQLAIVRGVIQPDAPLCDMDDQPGIYGTDFSAFVLPKDWALRSLLEGGVPMIPPDVPAQFINDGHVSEHYDPSTDAALVKFVRLIGYYGQASLQLDQSPSTRRGFAWFIDPATVRVGWPSIPALFLFEARLVDAALDIIVEHGDLEARAEIAKAWDLPPLEVQQVMALGMQACALRRRLADRDGNKALLMAKLERTAHKAEEAFDHRGAGMIYSQMWKLFRDEADADAEDTLADMDYTVGNAAAQRRLPKPKR